MIVTLTTFKLPQPITRDEAKAIFLSTAPKYQSVTGLVSKSYLFGDDGVTVGGVYVWHKREDAQALYTDAWRAFVREKYGTEPLVAYFDSPVTVDNVTGKILAHE